LHRSLRPVSSSHRFRTQGEARAGCMAANLPIGAIHGEYSLDYGVLSGEDDCVAGVTPVFYFFKQAAIDISHTWRCSISYAVARQISKKRVLS
jgi:hypothetical protein